MSRHLVFVSTELAPELPGGAGWVIAELARRLAEEGDRVTMLVVAKAEIPSRPGVEVRVVSPGDPDQEAPTPFLARSRAAARAVDELEEVDRVEFQDFDGLGFWALAHRSDLGLERTPLLVRMHAPVDLIAEAAGAESPDWPAVRAMERHAFSMADGVLVASQAMAELALGRYRLEPERVVVGEPPVPALAPVPHRRAEIPEFVCLGRLGEQKGSDLFLQAALTLLEDRSDLRFRFLGGEGWSLRQGRPMGEWLAQSVPARFAGRISFEGPVPRQELGRALASAWAVVFPSRFETFCLAAHEARALGHAVVVPDIPAFRPFFSESTGALVYDGTVGGLAEAMGRLAT
ncbi:MAG: glycosyltransferase family 4 protein, partial [Actinomycetota bacterium]